MILSEGVVYHVIIECFYEYLHCKFDLMDSFVLIIRHQSHLCRPQTGMGNLESTATPRQLHKRNTCSWFLMRQGNSLRLSIHRVCCQVHLHLEVLHPLDYLAQKIK
jgi:hypothetical protein